MPHVLEAENGWRSWIETPVRWGGLVVGVAVDRVVTFSPESDVDLLYAVPVFGLCGVGGVLLADLLVHRAAGGVRQAEITPRRVRDHVPRGLTMSLGVQALLLTVLLVLCLGMASPGAADQAGGALSRSCHGATQIVGPWPGASYARPAFGGLVVGTAVCALVLRRVTLRAASDEQRRTRARATIGAWGLLVAVPLFAVSSTMALAVLALACGGPVESVIVWGLGLTAFVSAMTAGWALGALLLPQAHIQERS